MTWAYTPHKRTKRTWSIRPKRDQTPQTIHEATTRLSYGLYFFDSTREDIDSLIKVGSGFTSISSITIGKVIRVWHYGILIIRAFQWATEENENATFRESVPSNQATVQNIYNKTDNVIQTVQLRLQLERTSGSSHIRVSVFRRIRLWVSMYVVWNRFTNQFEQCLWPEALQLLDM